MVGEPSLGHAAHHVEDLGLHGTCVFTYVACRVAWAFACKAFQALWVPHAPHAPLAKCAAMQCSKQCCCGRWGAPSGLRPSRGPGSS